MDIRPALAGQIQITKNAPSKITVDLGAHDVMAVLGRTRGKAGLVNEEITIKSNIPGFSDLVVTINMQPAHKVFYHTLRLPAVPIVIEKKQRRYDETIWMSYSWKGQEVGRIPIDVQIDIKAESYAT